MAVAAAEEAMAAVAAPRMIEAVFGNQMKHSLSMKTWPSIL